MSSRYGHHHKRSKQPEEQWSEWGAPIWSAEHCRYYKERMNFQGKIDYEWIDTSLRETTGTTSSSTYPHTVPNDEDDLTERFGQLSTNDYYQHASTTGNTPDYVHTTATEHRQEYQSRTTQKTHAAKDPTRRGDKKNRDDDGGASYYASTSSNSTYPPDQTAYGGDDNGNYGDPGKGKATAQYTGYYVPQEEGCFDENDTQEAIRQTRNTSANLGTDDYYNPGDPANYGSASTYDVASSYGSSSSYAPSTHEAYSSFDYTTAGIDYSYASGGAAGADEGPATPHASSPTHMNIVGSGGEYETVDPRYRVEPSYKFQPGEVFKILWAEPSGQIRPPSMVDEPLSDVQTAPIQTGNGKFFVGYRRFIVVAGDEGNCTCVPILTYERRACTKRGVKAHKHGIIYSGKHQVKPLKGERELGYPPVPLRIYADGESLAKESRVNYSKLVTIEHNVKVFFIGSIDANDFEHVKYAVDQCWQNKFHRKATRKTRR